MVNSVPLVSSVFSRTTANLSRNTLLSNLVRLQNAIQKTQEQLATGSKILRPSDDIIGSNQMLTFQTNINQNSQFIRNIDSANSRLAMADTSLSSMKELVDKAKAIALGQVGSTADATTRRLAASEIEGILSQAVSIGNTNFEGRNIFAGSKTGVTPFSFVGNAVAYLGDNNSVNTNTSVGLASASNISANNAFGVFSDGIKGTNLTTFNTIDLNPALRTTTKLSALNSGNGVSLGSITITGAASATIDLSTAETVGDVIDLINAKEPLIAGNTRVTASINAANNAIVLTRTDLGVSVSVAEVGNGRTAKDLGIFTASIASPFTGSDLNPVITKDTQIGDLLGGAGLTGLTDDGITITNATVATTFAATFGSAVFAATNKIESILNTINNAGIYVDARINEAGTGIDIFSRLSGARLTITETSGTTANVLGLLSTLRRAKLSDLNSIAGSIDARGITSVGGNDLRITRKDGVQVNIDIDNIATLNDLLNTIDADSGLTATLVGSNIQITDTTGGTGNLIVENINGSFAATDLGIAGSTTGVTITGTPLTFVGVQVEGVFTGLVKLRDGLLTNDTGAIRRAGDLLDTGLEKLLDGRSEVGAQQSALDDTKNRLDIQNVELEKMLGQVKDIDLAEAATRLQQQLTNLEAALSVSARILNISILDFL